MRRVAAVGLVALAACGRVGFGVLGDAMPGTGDASDAPDDGAPVCLPSYELCDGFEGTSFASYWTVNSTVTLDTTVAHRGSSSAHMQAGPLAINASQHAILTEAQTLPLGDTTFYVRAYIRLGALPVNANGMELIVAEEESGTSNGDYLFAKNGRLQLYDQFSNKVTNETSAPPLDTWMCVLWTVTRSTTTEGSLMLGGDPSPLSLTGVQTDGTTPPITVMAFGIGFAGPNVTTAQPLIDVWFDDLIIDKAPLTCAD